MTTEESSVLIVSASRKILLPVLMSHVKALLERQEEQCACVDILSEMMDLLHSEEMVSSNLIIITDSALDVRRKTSLSILK